MKGKPVTAGMKTSEFWLTFLIIITATILTLANKLEASQWMVAVGISGAGYSFSRGLAKSK